MIKLEGEYYKEVVIHFLQTIILLKYGNIRKRKGENNEIIGR